MQSTRRLGRIVTASVLLLVMLGVILILRYGPVNPADAGKVTVKLVSMQADATTMRCRFAPQFRWHIRTRGRTSRSFIPSAIS